MSEFAHTHLQEAQTALENALDSFSLEFLTPSQAQLTDLEAWVLGEISDQQLMESAYEIWQRQ